MELDFGEWPLSVRLYGSGSPPVQAQPTETTAAAEAPTNETVLAKDDPEIDPLTKPVEAEQESDALVSAENGGRPSGARPPRSVPRNNRNFVPGPPPLGRGNDRSRGGAVPASQNVPEPLSEAQINAMTLPEVDEALGLVAVAIQRSHPDEATRDRLRNEFKLLMARKRTGR